MESTQMTNSILTDEPDNQSSIKEGQAEILLTTKKVFYNPVQEFNRDLSIAVLSVFGDDYKEVKTARILKKTDSKGLPAEIPEVKLFIYFYYLL